MVLASHCVEPTLSRPRYRWAMLDYRAAERPSGWTLNDNLTACSCAVGKEAISEVRLQLGERKIRTASWSNGSDCARRRARAYRVLGHHSQSWFFASFLIKQKAKEKTALVLIKSADFGHPLNMNKSQKNELNMNRSNISNLMVILPLTPYRRLVIHCQQSIHW